ncbi:MULTISPECIES: phosphonate ABC transporter, permease protein PhnE [unclassified Salinibacterium]|uniref:phosphonate ABC transporter, permease protein PhnE n=1 Tax=unclassified Salinibacterium TaxID=2632331 RepID=UPI001CD2E8A1|nr:MULTISPECIES: phosphonate ABC transporter, permease protein PhnE [unclassified Salinibacterium]
MPETLIRPRDTSDNGPRFDERLSAADRARLSRSLQVPGTGGVIGLVVVVALVAWSVAGSGVNLERFLTGLPRMGEFLSRMWPPSFDKFGTIVELLIETLQMAVVGTLIGALLSLIVSFGAASNIAPRWLYGISRFVLNVLRSVPDLIFALMFVSAVGLGPFAGILALILGSIGSIGKIYAEAMESVPNGPLEALNASGASKRQVITYGVLPQASPLLVSYSLLLFEGNVRGATILGLVGAGGIGMELTTAMRMYDYGHLLAILISIIVLVTVIDRISAIIRKKVT